MKQMNPQSRNPQAAPQGAIAQQQQQQQQHHGHSHAHRRLNLSEYETEDEILDAIEQSRRVTRLIISAVQKGSNFEVSQILEHYGLLMTARLHFKVVSIVMEQWFSLMGIEDEEQIWNILRKNEYAMEKIRSVASKGTMVLSDVLTEWELPIGGLQSKIIRRIQDHIEEETKIGHKISFKNKGQNGKEQQKQQNNKHNVNNNNNNNNNDIDEKQQNENESNNNNIKKDDNDNIKKNDDNDNIKKSDDNDNIKKSDDNDNIKKNDDNDKVKANQESVKEQETS